MRRGTWGSDTCVRSSRNKTSCTVTGIPKRRAGSDLLCTSVILPREYRWVRLVNLNRKYKNSFWRQFWHLKSRQPSPH